MDQTLKDELKRKFKILQRIEFNINGRIQARSATLINMCKGTSQPLFEA
jgi:hypothetical protein